MYGISVKRKMIAGNTANVKLKATARDFSKISSSISFDIKILNKSIEYKII